MMELVDKKVRKVREQLTNGTLNTSGANRYLEDFNLDDTYNLREIKEMQKILVKRVAKMFDVMGVVDFIVYSDWCVHVSHVNFISKDKILLKRYLRGELS